MNRGVRQLRALGNQGEVVRTPQRWPLRLAGAGGLALLAIVVAMPRPASAAAFVKQAIDAMRKIEGYHQKEYGYDAQGNAKLFREYWIKGNFCRIESSDRLDVNTETQAWVLRKDLKQAITFKVDADYMKNLSGNLSLATILEREPQVGKRDIEIDEGATFNGQPAIKLTIDYYDMRSVLYFDHGAMIPLLINRYNREDGEWKKVGYTVPDYPKSFDPKLFQPDIASDVKLTDTDQMSHGAANRLTQELCSRP